MESSEPRSNDPSRVDFGAVRNHDGVVLDHVDFHGPGGKGGGVEHGEAVPSLPPPDPSPTARRMGSTAEKMGGWDSRWVTVCRAPPASSSTRRRVSPSNDPVAEYRPTSESREKEKSFITREGERFTLVRTTAVPVWPRAGSSRDKKVIEDESIRNRVQAGGGQADGPIPHAERVEVHARS